MANRIKAVLNMFSNDCSGVKTDVLGCYKGFLYVWVYEEILYRGVSWCSFRMDWWHKLLGKGKAKYIRKFYI
ncbi:MAG: hypothetical protein J6B68_05800 [Lachnospiraceae bacterium]|nr:hypothetical protein [Lachnospiraceae bacterium]